MKLTVMHQEKYSRGELLLRLFFGWLYIGIPTLLSARNGGDLVRDHFLPDVLGGAFYG